jgi:hypothetical protein
MLCFIIYLEKHRWFLELTRLFFVAAHVGLRKNSLVVLPLMVHNIICTNSNITGSNFPDTFFLLKKNSGHTDMIRCRNVTLISNNFYVIPLHSKFFKFRPCEAG